MVSHSRRKTLRVFENGMLKTIVGPERGNNREVKKSS
jgi:hypothetical protein